MFNISKNIPSKLTISLKENIPALTGTIISQQYYFSIDDYQNIVSTTNSIIDHINFLYPKVNNINLSSSPDFVSSVTKIITGSFISINKVNGEEVSYTNLDVVTGFFLNDYFYTYNINNEGHIKIVDTLISGSEEDFVSSFNGKTGNVTGITGILLNNEVLEIDDGLANLSNLSFKDSYIQSINNVMASNITHIITTVKEYDNTICLTTNNRNEVGINSLIIREKNQNNKVVLLHNEQKIELRNVDEEDERSAINKKYLANNYVTDLIIKINIETNEIVLPKHYYPLHFYDNNGLWKNISWDIEETTQNNIITISTTEVPNVKLLTAMKVTE